MTLKWAVVWNWIQTDSFDEAQRIAKEVEATNEEVSQAREAKRQVKSQSFGSAEEAWAYRQKVAEEASKRHKAIARRENTPELLRQLSDELLDARIAELEKYLPEKEEIFEKASFFEEGENGHIPTRLELEEQMDKREKAAAYLPGLWAERKRRSDEDLIEKAKRISQQPVVPKPVKTIDLLKYAGKDPKRPHMRGVHYANGEAISTDGMVIISRKVTYPTEYEGSTRGKKGEVVEGEFPDYKRVLNKTDGGKHVEVDVEQLRINVARALEAQESHRW